jgi:hypothetical protein
MDTAPNQVYVARMPLTTTRGFRIPDPIYKRAFKRAQSEQTSLSAIVRDCLAQYGRGGPVWIPDRTIPASDEWRKLREAIDGE